MVLFNLLLVIVFSFGLALEASEQGRPFWLGAHLFCLLVNVTAVGLSLVHPSCPA